MRKEREREKLPKLCEIEFRSSISLNFTLNFIKLICFTNC